MKNNTGKRHRTKVYQALASTLVTLPRGVMGTAFPKQPEKPLKLYEFEACPYCRRVRDVITRLNLDVEIYPCPKNGTRFRPMVQALGGQAQFPFLIDENTGDQLYESKAIIAHLFTHYSHKGRVPLSYQLLPPVSLVGGIAVAVNSFDGMTANANNVNREAPEQLLELWSFEASPFSRIVRAKLTELEIPYKLHNVPKERWQDQGPANARLKPGKYVPLADGKRAREITNMQGKMQVPFLIDPNTGVEMFESRQIVKYLDKQYG